MAARHRRIPGASRPTVARVGACPFRFIGVIAPWTRGSPTGVPLKEVGAMTSPAGRYRPRSPRRRRPPPAACSGTRACRPSPPAWGGPGTHGCRAPTRPGPFTNPWLLPHSRRSTAKRGVPLERVGAIAVHVPRAWLPRSIAAAPQISVVGLGRVPARHDPGPEVLAPRVLTHPGVAMVDPASTWWFSADRRWHKGQPPHGWWQGPDRRWHPPTEAPAPSPEPPAAPPTAVVPLEPPAAPRTAVEPAEPAASDGPSDTGPSHAQGARHRQRSPRRFWNRRHSE